MSLAWPERIDYGRQDPHLQNEPKTCDFEIQIRQGFWPPLRTGQNSVSGGPLRSRFYPRPADHSLADSRDAGIRYPPGLEDHFAGQRNRLGGFSAGEAGGKMVGGRAA